MDLDEFKKVTQNSQETFLLKELPELGVYMRARTLSIIDSIRRSLKFEIVFALLFLTLDCLMLFFFFDVFYMRLFTILLLAFAVSFILYVFKLLRYIRKQYHLDTTVNDLLTRYIYIISRFTKLYLQVTLVMVPLLFVMAFTAVYLDQGQSVNFGNVTSFPTIILYTGIAGIWCIIMYFFARWYIKKLYGNHLNKLKEQLTELHDIN